MMGLFDRIRGNDEEVEIQPPRERQGYDFDRSDESDEEEAEEEEFVLPGMAPASDSSSSSSSSRSSRNRRSRGDDSVERLVEQNERIIELLEELTGDDAGTDSVL